MALHCEEKKISILLHQAGYFCLLHSFPFLSIAGSCFSMQYLVSFLVVQHLAEDERAGCSAFNEFLMLCDCDNKLVFCVSSLWCHGLDCACSVS